MTDTTAFYDAEGHVTQLVAVLFTPAYSDGLGGDKKAGFVVPDTDNTLAVYERWDDHWHVNHLPSGRAIMPPHLAEFVVREQAIGFARRFYAEMTKLGANLNARDFEKERKRVWDELAHDNCQAFWTRVL